MSQPNPLIRNTVNYFMGKLFSHEKKRLDDLVDKLCEKASAIKKKTIYSFWLQGKLYITQEHANSFRSSRVPVPRETLPFELLPEANEYLAEEGLLKKDEAEICQMLALMVRECKSVQQLRDMLPECLVQLHPELNKLLRTAPPAYLFADNLNRMAQYEKVLPRIEFYVAMKMFY